MCVDLYYLNTTTNTCLPCSSNCIKCSMSGCSECITNYVVNENNTCSVLCTIPMCLSCQNATACFFCSPFTTLSDDQGSCPCNANYYFSDNQCIPCSTSILNCKNCLSSSVCTECNEGYALNLSTLACQLIS